MTTRLVFLVPGSFGFTSVGAVSHFESVDQALGQALRRRGVEARIARCRTQPTASIPRRVDVLRRQVVRRGGLAAQELHFVGHSTGGLDMRMLLAPGVKISRIDSEQRIGRLTRSAISVATPHHGTPLANHSLTLQGQTLLLVLSGLATSGQGRGTILAAAKATLRALFRLLHALTARPHPRYPYPKPAPAVQRRLEQALGFKSTPATNDGIVPAWSQLRGRLLHVARADHLDVVGHYTLAGGRTADWLPSGAGFTPEAFEATWDAVAAAIARSGQATRAAGSPTPC